MDYVKDTENTVKNVFNRIKTRNFSGNTGLTVKNSIYNFSATLAAKVGSLIFTIILARLLMPELFGLYSLALSTILIFTAFSQIGLSQTIVRFVSKSIGKKEKSKAKNYIIYFGKIQSSLAIMSSILLIMLSKFISGFFYQKPIFLALIAGCFYIIFMGISSFFISVLNSFNDFKHILFQEIILQISRVILVPLIVIYSLKISLSNEIIFFYIVLSLSSAYLISGLYSFLMSRKIICSRLKNKDGVKNLSKKDKKESNKFIFLTAAIILSGTFFGNIDRIMLGRFVSGEFIGYYTAAFSLVGALVALGMFGAVLLPIFSRMNKKELDNSMKKSIEISSLIGLIMFLLTIIFSYLSVLVIYGQGYIQAVNVLRLLAILVLIMPVIGVYIAYFMSENKPIIIAKAIALSTVLNVLLNYILIISLLPYGELNAVYGAAIATVISQVSYLLWLKLAYKREMEV